MSAANLFRTVSMKLARSWSSRTNAFTTAIPAIFSASLPSISSYSRRWSWLTCRMCLRNAR